ncbi:MAG: hypothetical protein GYA66_12895, partial [Phyllobacteriaceae bacterium]|nr:hypothetical protein [Phyllobacteriaceae bacterium]
MASLKHFAILLLPVQLVYWFVLAVTSTTSHAQLGSIIGVVGGSALIDNAGDEFEKSVASAKAAAESLSDRVNGHARDRLDQIDLIVNRTGAALIGRSEDAALTILREASDELETLEEKAFADAKALIWEFECAGKRLTRDDVRHVFGKFGNWLSLYEFEIAP